MAHIITNTVMNVKQFRHRSRDGAINQDGDSGPMGNRIKEIRNSQGLSMADLAARVETSAQQIEKLEKGKRRLSQQWLDRVSAGLGVTPAELLPFAGEQPEVSKQPRQVFQDRRQSEVWRFMEGLTPQGRAILMDAIRSVMRLAVEIAKSDHDSASQRRRPSVRRK